MRKDSTEEMKKTGKIDSRVKTFICFFLLLLFLLWLFYPSFGNPPRSDWWSAFYSFHLAGASPGPPDFWFIINHDPWRDGTFRPLAHPLLYLEHLLFGPKLIGYHLVNFGVYFLVLLALYRFGRQLKISRKTLVAFLGLLAVLFTHFDIVTWTFHVFLLLGLLSFLLGLVLYFRWLEGGRSRLLILTAVLFLFSLFTLEVYLLWPLGVFLITLGKIPPPRRRYALALTGTVYCLYLLVFMISRSVSHTSGSIEGFGIEAVYLSLTAVFFNLFYNGILINIIPFLALPLRIAPNIEMTGPVSFWTPATLRTVSAVVGTVSLILIGAVIGIRNIRKKIPAGLGLLFFLYVSSFFILALGRTGTENFPDLFTQFRYQFLPNCFLVLMGALVLDQWVVAARKRNRFYLFVCLIAVLNIAVVRSAVTDIGSQLSPLKKLIVNLRTGIEKGEISRDKPAALPDGITGYLPPLCWNRHMARFFRGTYQWIFSRNDIFCFTPFIGDAAWIVDAETQDYRRIRPNDPPVLPQRNIPKPYRQRAGKLETAD